MVADGHRCFLFLVNYARMKPEVALKALPTLEEVSGCLMLCAISANRSGYERLQPPRARPRLKNNVLHTRSRVRRGQCATHKEAATRPGSIRAQDRHVLRRQVV